MDVKLRSIPPKSRYQFDEHADKERRRRLAYQELLELEEKYEAKKKELQEVVSNEAVKLQKTVEERDRLKKQVEEEGKKRERLDRKLTSLEKDLKKAENSLLEEKEARNALIREAKKELQEKKTLIAALNSLIEILNTEASRLKSVSRQVARFIRRESEVRGRYLEEAKRLREAQNKRNKAISETDKEKRESAKRTKDLDEMKEYLVELSGKLTTRHREITEATEYINEELKKHGVPVEYELPPKKIKKIPFK